MARQRRFSVPGLPHLVAQRGHNGQAVISDARDAQLWLDILRDVSLSHRVALHGWRLSETEFALLLTPSSADGLSRLCQDWGRRYVGAFNARHGRSGTLWDGRFRCALVGPGAWELRALAWLERDEPVPPGHASRAHHLGLSESPALTDPKSYWSLGNTPFERHSAWRHRLDGAGDDFAWEQALRSGRPIGDAPWRSQLQALTTVPLEPRPRGRPTKALAALQS